MLRRLTSLTAFLSFALVLATSVVLYIVPAGRIAYWADWKLLGLSKEQWGALHINLGTLFLLALGLHVWYNWKSILNYLKAKATARLSPELLSALALSLVVTVGTLAEVPPFSSFLHLNAWFKDQAVLRYGEPPYGHAELSTVAAFAPKAGLDLGAALANLEAASMAPASPKETLAELAKRHNVPPQRVYEIMRRGSPGEAAEKTGGLPSLPPSGTGQLTLEEFTQKHGLDLQISRQALAQAGIQAQAGRTLKQIAQDAGRAPTDVYDILRASAKP